MPRRVELRGVIDGFLDKFLSRNNDVNGYWGIGKLVSLQNKKRVEEIQLDLLSLTMKPSSREFKKLIPKYKVFLFHALGKKGLPESWLCRAQLRFSATTSPLEAASKKTSSDPYQYLWDAMCAPDRLNSYLCTVTLELETDLGRTLSRTDVIRACPHDPKLESKRYKDYINQFEKDD